MFSLRHERVEEAGSSAMPGSIRASIKQESGQANIHSAAFLLMLDLEVMFMGFRVLNWLKSA